MCKKIINSLTIDMFHPTSTILSKWISTNLQGSHMTIPRPGQSAGSISSQSRVSHTQLGAAITASVPNNTTHHTAHTTPTPTPTRQTPRAPLLDVIILAGRATHQRYHRRQTQDPVDADPKWYCWDRYARWISSWMWDVYSGNRNAQARSSCFRWSIYEKRQTNGDIAKYNRVNGALETIQLLMGLHQSKQNSVQSNMFYTRLYN